MSKVKPAKRDKYDRAVRYLTKHPEKIMPAWHWPGKHSHGCLFQWAAEGCGCLTQIRVRYKEGPTAALTRAIRRDKRIPQSVGGITAKDLPVFAEWQRKLDAAGVR